MNKGMTKYKLYIKHFRICIERNYTFVSSGFMKKKNHMCVRISFHTDFNRICFFSSKSKY